MVYGEDPGSARSAVQHEKQLFMVNYILSILYTLS